MAAPVLPNPRVSVAEVHPDRAGLLMARIT
jgi:hypothetical protein